MDCILELLTAARLYRQGNNKTEFLCLKIILHRALKQDLTVGWGCTICTKSLLFKF